MDDFPTLQVPAPWLLPTSIEEAKRAQHEMAQRVSANSFLDTPIAYIAGVDVSNTPFDPSLMIYGSAVILSYPELKVIETKNQADRQTFPYVPGLLGFREVPTLVGAYQQLMQKPDLIMVDGHGISHPRGLGIASHLGLLLDIPTIGVAKSILVGTPSGPLGEDPGSCVSLLWKGQEIAKIVRTKRRCNPLIISAGHKINLDQAVELVFSSLKKYRLPEPTRQAHLAANACRKKQIQSKEESSE